MDEIEAAGLFTCVLAIMVFCILILSHPFPIMDYAPSTEHLLNTTQSIGPETARFMWTYRNIDLITQALVLFVAAVGCLAILRTEEEKAEGKAK